MTDLQKEFFDQLNIKMERAGTAPERFVASIPDDTAKFGKRYGDGETALNAAAALIKNLTGRSASIVQS